MHHRRERLNDLLLSFLAGELRGLRDPRLSLVTLTGVEASPDYKFAKVFWSALSAGPKAEAKDGAAGEAEVGRFLSAQEIAQVQKALEGAEGLLRKRVADELELRYTPKLQFKHDASAQTGSRIEELLKKAGL